MTHWHQRSRLMKLWLFLRYRPKYTALYYWWRFIWIFQGKPTEWKFTKSNYPKHIWEMMYAMYEIDIGRTVPLSDLLLSLHDEPNPKLAS